ncbi:hypothetical protein B0A50_00218 [Salinomyces thailandicus]|uniref:Uncharacterized protein n=1 Tax=Salinomyces thailandicus TaxID=706561 RepID=A0A4U0UFB4_9PEZI|nr:hypothetical protein B0A50_00218 [Salinomyces thailandica]
MEPARETGDVPTVPILLLGDAGVGKSTFLSWLTLGQNPSSNQTAPTLRDLDQPFSFDIRMYNRPYRFEFFDTASPTNYTLLNPSLVILCYSIADPPSLTSLQKKWRLVVEEYFNLDESIPVIVLGLQRDIRAKEDYAGHVRPSETENGEMGEDEEVLRPRTFVYPQEALRTAQEMRCDRYCECSALTGELCREVFEDIARTAAMTTTERGGRTQGTSCAVM